MPRTPKALFSTPAETEHAFYDALERADLEGLMSLWAEDEDVICIHPGGPRIETLVEIRASWREVLNHGPLHIRPTRISTVQGMLVAVHTVVEELVIHNPDNTQVAYINATNVYHKTGRGWRLVLHHASPATETPDVPPNSALH